MANRGGRYFRQMEPYEKRDRIIKGMACLKHEGKVNKNKVRSSGGL